MYYNALISFFSANSLKCFVGLGNSSKKHDMKVVECPEGKFYVCVKMFGGGMGDQIRRYCEAIPREVHRTNLNHIFQFLKAVAQCGNLWIFVPCRFYVKSIKMKISTAPRCAYF